MTKRAKHEFYPVAMSIAGSDSGGGAGIAADLRTFNAMGIFGTFAITAVTSQNPAAVHRVDPIAPEAVVSQIDAVMEKIAVKWCKTGMLLSAGTIEKVADAVKKYNLKLVCDPVMVSTSGAKLLDDDAVAVMKDKLLPLTAWITPNIPEAELLTGKKITSVAEMMDAAADLSDAYRSAILLKGGHLPGERATDVIAREGKCYTLSVPALEIPPLSSHGTGCTLSAALTGMLALDFPWKQAVCDSKSFVYSSLAQCVEIGANLFAMYPPSEDVAPPVKLVEVEQQ